MNASRTRADDQRTLASCDAIVTDPAGALFQTNRADRPATLKDDKSELIGIKFA